MAQFLLIASLALGSSSAFAEGNSDSEFSSQMLVEAEDSISEELKSIYQEEVDQVLAEGISYSEEERLSDFPDLDSLLADDSIPNKIAKISKGQKVEKGKFSDSKVGIQNRKTISEIFSDSSNLSQNCTLGLNVLLPISKLGQVGLEFLPRFEAGSRTVSHEVFPVPGNSYANLLPGCPGRISLYLSGEGYATKSVCSIENQRNLLIWPGVPTTESAGFAKTVENALESGLSQEFGQILDISHGSGRSHENRTFFRAYQHKGSGVGKSAIVHSGHRVVAIEFSMKKVEIQSLSQDLHSSLKRDLSMAGQDSYKFSSGRPTPEILT
ncbi:hypothetical protein [Leptospira neocaledonica]|uniref:hypothetical protein n=1 Tax=Leptospira neocaledonica TaxID=2023192 RepID=UPI001FCC3FF5|nr:hypothetical protein [Leptospira neocaledonica]